MVSTAQLEAAARAAGAEVDAHKRAQRHHRQAAQEAAQRRDTFKAALAAHGIAFVTDRV